MNRLQLAHLPLRTKLIAASALTASLALLIAAITQGISSYFYSHSEAYEHVNAVARVVVGRSSAAIQSQDFGQAEALVSALRVEPNVEEAMLVDSHQRVLMHYAGSKTMLMAKPGGEPTDIQQWQNEAMQANEHLHRFDGLTALHLVYPISDQGQVIGHLYVRANLSELQEKLLVQMGFLLGSSVAALAVAYLMARRVQRQIAAPLMNLVDVMSSAERGDYSKRASVTSDVEIGHLLRGFNGMLGQIENREQELGKQQ
jgi:methyl-accepting chemotaxis protein